MKLPWISTVDVSEIAIQHSSGEESINFIVASQKIFTSLTCTGKSTAQEYSMRECCATKVMAAALFSLVF